MKNILVISIIFVLVGLGFWISKSGKKNAEIVAENMVPVSAETSSVQKPSSNTGLSVKNTVSTEVFTNILPHKGNYECEYEEVTQSSRSSHNIYLSDGKMRGEFRTYSVSGGISNIMVYDGSRLYTWIEGQTVGTSMVPKSLSDFPSIIPKDILQSKILGSGLNSASWNCHAWSRVPSLLAKPSYVKF
ncbi:MAG: hypothetical protein WAX44_02535 [Minisyncoccia bacterium]